MGTTVYSPGFHFYRAPADFDDEGDAGSEIDSMRMSFDSKRGDQNEERKGTDVTPVPGDIAEAINIDEPIEPLVEDLTTFPYLTVERIFEIDDWTKRMDDYNYTKEQREVVNRCIKKTKEWFHLKENSKWKLQEDAKKEGIIIHNTTSERGLNFYKATGVVDFPVHVCL